jgi:ankyrin repeat protein
MVELLIVSDESVAHPSKGSAALITAAKKGDVDVVTRLLSYGVPPDIVGPDGTALNEAAGHGHEDVIRALLAGGADLNNDEGNGLTPLHIAVKAGLTNTVRLLLENDADVNKVKDRGSAFGSAVESGDEEIVMLLLIKGALVEGNEGPQFLSPLQAAVFKGYERIVKALLDAGADVNALDEAGLSPSPLRYACQVNREDIARLLLERGANVNAADQHHSLTPIQFCCAMGYESLVHTLVSFHADIDAPHPDGCALDRAVDKGYLSIVTHLLDHGANPDIDTERGRALQTAAFRGDVAMATLLLDHGADIDHSCGDACPGWNASALYQAVAEDHAGVTRLLVRRSARFEVAIGDAMRSGNAGVMEMLLALETVSEMPGNRLMVEE